MAKRTPLPEDADALLALGEQLRRRVSRSIEKLCRHMSGRDLGRTAEYVLSLSS